MSLINDALKRARENQQRAQSPASPRPPLEPAVAPPVTGGGGAKFTLYLLIFCVVVGNLLLFVYASRRQAAQAADLEAAARTVGASPATAMAVEPPTPAPSVAESTPAPALAEAEIPAVPAVPSEPVIAEPAPPAVAATPPAPLRLQSVILAGQRSSAMISGKVLFLGDRIQGWQVTRIDGETVTLVRNGETNVLALP
ncbi:MAG: hypothetical protein ACK45B_12125 [Limisphaerales bacterium]